MIRSLNFLEETVFCRLRHFFQKEPYETFVFPDIKLEKENALLNNFLLHYQMSNEEYVILLLALTPHIHPNFLAAIIQQFLPNGGDFPEIGGVKGNNLRATLPTGETARFIIAGNDTNKKLQAMQYFSSDHFFAKENILFLEPVKNGEPRMSGRIILAEDYIDLFTTGVVSKPAFGPEFPAKNITTKMEWEDVILNPKTAQAINDIKTWLHHNYAFMKDSGMDKKNTWFQSSVLWSFPNYIGEKEKA